MDKIFYVFISVNRLQDKDICDRLMELSRGYTDVQLYVFNTNERPFSVVDATLTLPFQLPLTIHEITFVFDPPEINDDDHIVNCIANDKELLPLKGGYIALDRWISQHSTPITIL